MPFEQEVGVHAVGFPHEVERIAEKWDRTDQQIDRQVAKHPSDHDGRKTMANRHPNRVEPDQGHRQIAHSGKDEADQRVEVPIVEPVGQHDDAGHVAIARVDGIGHRANVRSIERDMASLCTGAPGAVVPGSIQPKRPVM